jgi:hypothetical protein
MGWTSFADSPYLSRTDIIVREFSQRPTVHNPKAWGFVKAWERGSIVYAVMWHENPEKFEGRLYYGIVFLTQRKRGEFSYKDMDESMGPYAYGAPVAMLDMLDDVAPKPPGLAIEWRARCRQAHAMRKAKTKTKNALKPGDIVKFSPSGREFELVFPAGSRRGWNVRIVGENMLYRATSKQINNCQVIVKGV